MIIKSPRRVALAALGLLCVGLALVGVVLPGLPTTIFLIAASYLFARSCPILEEKLIRNRLFRPYLQYLEGRRPMPLKAKLTALALMWTAVTASLLVIAAGGKLEVWLASVIVGAALVGSVVIASYGPRARQSSFSYAERGRGSSNGSRLRP